MEFLAFLRENLWVIGMNLLFGIVMIGVLYIVDKRDEKKLKEDPTSKLLDKKDS